LYIFKLDRCCLSFTASSQHIFTIISIPFLAKKRKQTTPPIPKKRLKKPKKNQKNYQKTLDNRHQKEHPF